MSFSVTYSPNGNTIASACYDGTVRFWHTRTGREKMMFVVT